MRIVNAKREDISRLTKDFVSSIDCGSNSRILIKPNFVCLDDYPYTTAYDVINGILNALTKKGVSKITIAEAPSVDNCFNFNQYGLDYETAISRRNKFHSFIRSSATDKIAQEYFEGHQQIIEEYITYFFNSKKHYVLDYAAKYLFFEGLKVKKLKVSEKIISIADISEFDVIINLPVLKGHSTTGFTGALKNLFCIVYDFDKLLLHKYKLIGQALISLNEYLQGLNIHTFLDAREVPYSQQPGAENNVVSKLDLIISSNNLVEVDKLAKKILRDNGILRSCKDVDYLEFLS